MTTNDQGVQIKVGVKLGDEESKAIGGHRGSFHGETGSDKGGKDWLGPHEAEVKCLHSGTSPTQSVQGRVRTVHTEDRELQEPPQPQQPEDTTKQGKNSDRQLQEPECFLILKTGIKILEWVINIKLDAQRFIRGIQSRCEVILGGEEGVGVAGEKRNSSEMHLSGIKS